MLEPNCLSDVGHLSDVGIWRGLLPTISITFQNRQSDSLTAYAILSPFEPKKDFHPAFRCGGSTTSPKNAYWLHLWPSTTMSPVQIQPGILVASLSLDGGQLWLMRQSRSALIRRSVVRSPVEVSLGKILNPKMLTIHLPSLPCFLSSFHYCSQMKG